MTTCGSAVIPHPLLCPLARPRDHRAVTPCALSWSTQSGEHARLSARRCRRYAAHTAPCLQGRRAVGDTDKACVAVVLDERERRVCVFVCAFQREGGREDVCDGVWAHLVAVGAAEWSHRPINAYPRTAPRRQMWQQPVPSPPNVAVSMPSA